MAEARTAGGEDGADGTGDAGVVTGGAGGADRAGGAGRGARARPRWRDRHGWRRGLVTAALALLAGVLMIAHAAVPNRIGNLGSLLETFLPWLGLAVPVLLAVALLRRSVVALAALLLPVVAWCGLFGGLVTDKAAPGGDLTVLTHNVDAANADPAGTARAVAGSGAGLIALEELTPKALPVYERVLAARYPYRVVEGTVALWSRYPLTGTRPVTLRLGWTRALRTTAATPAGPVAVYVAHMPSVRVRFDGGFTAGQRDASASALGDAIAAEPVRRVVLLGDLNGTVNDRALSPVTSQLRSAQGAAGDGFGFSWPAAFPMARIDQILVRGVAPRSSWVLPATGSDHRPVAARLSLS